MPARKRRKIAIEAADHEQIRNESENATEKLLDVDYDPENAGLGLCTLANLFFIEKKYDQAEKKYLQAIDEGYDEAISGLIKVYRKTGRNDLAEKYLILSGELNQNRQCENYVEVGDLYFSEKKYTAAERYYLKAIAENYPEGYVGLGKVYTERKKYKDAQKNFLIAIEKGSTTTANFGLGNLAVKQKKYHDAEKYFTKALQNDYMPAALALGEMFTQLGVSQRAEYYLRIVGDETRDPKEMITIGDFYLKNKNADLARQWYLKAISLNNDEAIVKMAELLERTKHLAEAEAYYLQAVTKEHAGSVDALAGFYERNGKLADAEKNYLKSIKDGHADSLYHLALLYLREQNYPLAEKYLLHAVNAGNNRGWYDLGILMLELNREEEAETYLLKAIDFLEDDYQLAEAYELLGNVYLNHKKDYKNAEKCFLRAVENGNVSGYYHLAKIYEHENKFSKAEWNYLQAIEVGRKDATYDLGMLYASNEKYDQAVKYLMIAADTLNPIAIYQLALILDLKLQRFDDALKYYILAIEQLQEPEVGNAAFNTGRIYENKGDLANAEKYYRHGIQHNFNKCFYGLGTVFLKQNKTKEAEECLLEAIRGELSKEILRICYRELALIYDRTDRYESAIKYYLLAIKFGYDDLNLAVADCMRRAKLYDNAQTYYLLAIKDHQYQAAENLGEISYEEGKIDQAIKFFEIAYKNQISRADLFLGDIFYDKHDYVEARKYYATAVNILHGEQLGDRLYRLGLTCLKCDDPVSAKTYFTKAVENFNSNAIGPLGDLHFQAREFKDAERYYLAALEKGDQHYCANLGRIYLYYEHFDLAEKYFLQAIQNHVADEDVYFELGNIYVHTNRFVEAKNAYEQAIALKLSGKHLYSAHFMLGMIAEKSKQYDEAIKQYLIVLDVDSYDDLKTCAFNLARIYETLDDTKNAIKYYRLAVKYGIVDSYAYLAKIYAQTGDDEAMLECNDDTIAKNPQNVEFQAIAANQNGTYYYDKKDYEKAISYYDQAVTFNHIPSILNLANAYFANKDLQNAAKYYSLAYDHHFIQAASLLAVVDLELEQFNDALNYAQIAYQNGDIDSAKNVGFAAFKLKNYPLAYQYFKLAIDHGNEDPNLQLDYAITCVQVHQYEEAEKYLLIGVEQETLAAEYNLGLLYVILKRYHEAIPYLLKSLNKYRGEQNQEVVNALGTAYAQDHDYQKAFETYQKIENLQDVSIQLALMSLQLKDNANAKEYIIKAIGKDHFELLHELCAIYFAEKDYENTIKYGNLALEKGYDEHLILAQADFQLGKYDAALASYLTAYHQIDQADLPRANYEIGVCYKQQHDNANSVKYLVLADQAGYKDLCVEIADLYLALDQIAEGAPYLARAVNDKHYRFLKPLINYYQSINANDQLAHFYHVAVDQGEDYHYQLATLLYDQIHNYPDALQQFLLAYPTLSIEQVNPTAYKIGVCYQKQGDDEHAIKYFTIADQAKYQDLCVELAELYLHQKNPAAAEQYILRAIALNHDEFIEPLINYAKTIGDEDKLINAYQLALDHQIDRHYDLAKLYFARHEYDHALEHYLAVYNLLTIEEQPAIAYDLGIIYRERNDLANNLKYFVIADTAKFKDLCVEIANLCLDLNQPEQAYPYLVRAVEDKHYEFLHPLIDLLIKKDDYDQLVKYYLLGIATGTDYHLPLANLYYQHQDYPAALKEYLTCYEQLDPVLKPVTAYHMSNCYAACKDHLNTIKYCQIADDAKFKDLCVELATLLLNQNQPQAALPYMVRAIALGHLEFLNEVINLYKSNQDTYNLIKYYLIGIKNHQNFHYLVAEQYFNIHEYKNALHHYLTAIKTITNNNERLSALYNIAYIHEFQGNYREALTYYLAVDKKLFRDCAIEIAKIYLLFGNLHKAKPYLIRCIDQHQNEFFDPLVTACIHDHDYDNLIKTYLYGITIDRPAYFELANAFYHQGNYLAALEYYEKVTDVPPTAYPAYLLSLAECYRVKGDYQHARENYQRLLVEYPAAKEFNVAFNQLGTVDLLLNDYDELIALLIYYEQLPHGLHYLKKWAKNASTATHQAYVVPPAFLKRVHDFVKADASGDKPIVPPSFAAPVPTTEQVQPTEQLVEPTLVAPAPSTSQPVALHAPVHSITAKLHARATSSPAESTVVQPASSKSSYDQNSAENLITAALAEVEREAQAAPTIDPLTVAHAVAHVAVADETVNRFHATDVDEHVLATSKISGVVNTVKPEPPTPVDPLTILHNLPKVNVNDDIVKKFHATSVDDHVLATGKIAATINDLKTAAAEAEHTKALADHAIDPNALPSVENAADANAVAQAFVPHQTVRPIIDDGDQTLLAHEHDEQPLPPVDPLTLLHNLPTVEINDQTVKTFKTAPVDQSLLHPIHVESIAAPKDFVANDLNINRKPKTFHHSKKLATVKMILTDEVNEATTPDQQTVSPHLTDEALVQQKIKHHRFGWKSFFKFGSHRETALANEHLFHEQHDQIAPTTLDAAANVSEVADHAAPLIDAHDLDVITEEAKMEHTASVHESHPDLAPLIDEAAIKEQQSQQAANVSDVDHASTLEPLIDEAAIKEQQSQQAANVSDVDSSSTLEPLIDEAAIKEQQSQQAANVSDVDHASTLEPLINQADLPIATEQPDAKSKHHFGWKSLFKFGHHQAETAAPAPDSTPQTAEPICPTPDVQPDLTQQITGVTDHLLKTSNLKNEASADRLATAVNDLHLAEEQGYGASAPEPTILSNIEFAKPREHHNPLKHFVRELFNHKKFTHDLNEKLKQVSTTDENDFVVPEQYEEPEQIVEQIDLTQQPSTTPPPKDVKFTNSEFAADTQGGDYTDNQPASDDANVNDVNLEITDASAAKIADLSGYVEIDQHQLEPAKLDHDLNEFDEQIAPEPQPIPVINLEEEKTSRIKAIKEVEHTPINRSRERLIKIPDARFDLDTAVAEYQYHNRPHQDDYFPHIASDASPISRRFADLTDQIDQLIPTIHQPHKSLTFNEQAQTSVYKKPGFFTRLIKKAVGVATTAKPQYWTTEYAQKQIEANPDETLAGPPPRIAVPRIAVIQPTVSSDDAAKTAKIDLAQTPETQAVKKSKSAIKPIAVRKVKKAKTDKVKTAKTSAVDVNKTQPTVPVAPTKSVEDPTPVTDIPTPAQEVSPVKAPTKKVHVKAPTKKVPITAAEEPVTAKSITEAINLNNVPSQPEALKTPDQVIKIKPTYDVKISNIPSQPENKKVTIRTKTSTVSAKRNKDQTTTTNVAVVSSTITTKVSNKEAAKLIKNKAISNVTVEENVAKLAEKTSHSVAQEIATNQLPSAKIDQPFKLGKKPATKKVDPNQPTKFEAKAGQVTVKQNTNKTYTTKIHNEHVVITPNKGATKKVLSTSKINPTVKINVKPQPTTTKPLVDKPKAKKGNTKKV